jgi:hypothetical protein
VVSVVAAFAAVPFFGLLNAVTSWPSPMPGVTATRALHADKIKGKRVKR